jgi:hypothetical protein
MELKFTAVSEGIGNKESTYLQSSSKVPVHSFSNHGYSAYW